jgi:zinc transport system permease protein
MSFFEIIQLPFMQRSILCLTIASATFSWLGIGILVLNLGTLRFTLMHLGLLGSAVGMILGVNPLFSGIAFATIGSLLMGPVADKAKLNTSAISALFMTGSIALAFILFSKARVSPLQSFGIFTGNIFLLTHWELLAVFCLGLLIVITFIIGFWPIQTVLYNKEMAGALGLPGNLIQYVFLALAGCAIGIAIRLVGALMVDAVILLPAMAVLPLSKNLKQAMVLTSLSGVATSLIGITVSLLADLPVGASVTLSGVIWLIIIQTVFRRRKKRTVR